MKESSSLKSQLGKTLLIGISGIVLGWWMTKSCNQKNTFDSSDTTNKVTVITEWKDTVIYRDHHYYHYDTLKTEIPVYIDTTKVITDYYTFKAVQDSFIGKNYHIRLFDTLHQNSIHGRRAEINVLQVDSIIETAINNYKSANGFYLGLGTDLKSISPSIMYLRGQSAYGVNYNLTEKKINLNYHYKLFGK